MATPQNPQQLGYTTNIRSANGTPSGASAGYSTSFQRFINIWVGLAGGTSVDVSIWVYRTGIGWVLYADVPTTTVTTANGGGFFQLEMRGAERIYIQLANFVGTSPPPTPAVALLVEGITY